MIPDFESVLADERRRDAVRRSLAAREAERFRGVCWSGLGPGPAPPEASEDQLRAVAAARHACLKDWRASRRGRLMAAVSKAQQAAEQAHLASEAARAALARGDGSAHGSCRSAADVMEAQARALIAAARAARRALRPPPLEQDRHDAC